MALKPHSKVLYSVPSRKVCGGLTPDCPESPVHDVIAMRGTLNAW